jgi:CheY-like chemotaxis protein
MVSNQADVLLVEDDVALCLVLSAVLAQTGYRVRTATDGVSALVEIAKRIPDVIVSDLHMPRMSGFELLSMVRCQFPAIPLVAMSGAFSGTRVPPGICADAFYEKATHPVLLVQIVGAATCHRVVQGQPA